ncbi:MAG: hypothetical protein H7325_04375 [Pedobacter sp.]|nr:hypothetical protein [Pedobacter sp.]
MNTKYLMMASAIFMGILGLACTFLPKEMLDYVNLTATTLPALFIQITGALYLGFALMNWTAKTVLIGKIYAKPLSLGNFLHFTMAAITFTKAAFHDPNSTYIIIAAVAYSIFAVLFGIVLFTNPAKIKGA